MAVEALDGLAARGVASCQPDAIEAMQQAAFTSMPIKEISVIGPNGQSLCTHLGPRSNQRTISVAGPLHGADGYSIDVVRFPDGEQMIQLRRNVAGSPN